jgi:hypothetical protein
LTNGAPRIEINGELGEILALCKTSETTKPGRRRRALAEQIKVVAGARLGRDRHSLEVLI